MALALWTILCIVLIWSRKYSCKPLADGNARHLRHPRIRRNTQPCQQGINISDSIRAGPPIVEGERHLEDFVDKDFTLKCLSYSRTSANITWVLNNGKLLLAKPEKNCKYCVMIPLNSCYQELQIKRAEITDSGNYVCVVTNKYGTTKSTSSITVREKQLGKISIDKLRFEGENQKAILGGSVNIACTIIDRSGENLQTKWEKNGKRAVDDGKRLIWNRSGTFPDEKREKILVLTLKNVTVEDEGNWTCAVRGGRPRSLQRQMFTLITEPCPGGHYCPWRENNKYPCPYGTYTNGSSDGTVLSPTDCLECPGVPQGTQPKGSWQPAVSLGGCPAALNTCPENHYCYNRTSQLPCPMGTYFEWRNASRSSDCKECPRDTGQIGNRSQAITERCFDPITPTEKPGKQKTQGDPSSDINLKVVLGVVGGIAAIVFLVIFVFYYKCYFRSRNSLYSSGADVAMKHVHKESCQYQQKNLANRSTETCLSSVGEDTHPTLYDVFITYSSKDGDWVRGDLLSNLESRGFKCCIDIRDFMPGNAIVNNIADAVYRSKRTLAVLSPDFIESGWCKNELQHALARIGNHQVVPVLYRACVVPVELLDKTYVDWENPDVRPHFWDALERALKGVIGQCSCFREPEISKL